MLVDDSHEFISTYAIRCFTLGIVITFGNWNRPRLDLTYWEELFFGFHFTLTRKMLPPAVDGVIKLHKWHNVGADPNITMVRWKGQIYLTRVHAIVNFILFSCIWFIHSNPPTWLSDYTGVGGENYLVRSLSRGLSLSPLSRAQFIISPSLFTSIWCKFNGDILPITRHHVQSR